MQTLFEAQKAAFFGIDIFASYLHKDDFTLTALRAK